MVAEGWEVEMAEGPITQAEGLGYSSGNLKVPKCAWGFFKTITQDYLYKAGQPQRVSGSTITSRGHLYSHVIEFQNLSYSFKNCKFSTITNLQSSIEKLQGRGLFSVLS